MWLKWTYRQTPSIHCPWTELTDKHPLYTVHVTELTDKPPLYTVYELNLQTNPLYTLSMTELNLQTNTLYTLSMSMTHAKTLLPYVQSGHTPWVCGAPVFLSQAKLSHWTPVMSNFNVTCTSIELKASKEKQEGGPNWKALTVIWYFCYNFCIIKLIQIYYQYLIRNWFTW